MFSVLPTHPPGTQNPRARSLPTIKGPKMDESATLYTPPHYRREPHRSTYGEASGWADPQKSPANAKPPPASFGVERPTSFGLLALGVTYSTTSSKLGQAYHPVT